MNWTEPSAKTKLAPPGWFDLNPQVTCQFQMQLAGLTPRAVQLPLQSLQAVPTFLPSMGQLIGWMVWPWLTELKPAQPQLLPKRWNSHCSTSVSPIMMVFEVPSITSPMRIMGPPVGHWPATEAPRHIKPRHWA